MDILTILEVMLAIALLVEGFVEVLKPVYLSAKKFFTGREFKDCDPVEKRIMTLIVSIASCLILQKGVVIPGLTDDTPVLGQLIAGAGASLGSNVLHTAITLLKAWKDRAEAIPSVDDATPSSDNDA